MCFGRAGNGWPENSAGFSPQQPLPPRLSLPPLRLAHSPRTFFGLAMRQLTPIGGLVLELAEGWRFSLRDGSIAGRRGAQPGVLLLTSHGPNELESPITHESCLKFAAKFAKVPEAMLRKQQTIASMTGPFGWGS